MRLVSFHKSSLDAILHAMTQRDALDILKTGCNAFVTGPAGSGKTHVVNAYIRYLKSHHVAIGITASTGIAATHLGGMTIHSWSGMGIKDQFDLHDLEEIGERKQTANRIREAQVLVIDEVSMLHHFRLDSLDAILRHVRKSGSPFGGMQIVLCGDFFQLPPVSRYGDPDTQFIYRSKSWKDGNFVVCYLSENHRQKDDGMLDVLNEIRSGEVSDEARELLRSRHSNVLKKNGIGDAKGSGIEDGGENGQAGGVEITDIGEDPDTEPTRLYTHNVDVDKINEQELDKVPGLGCVYEMRSKGKKHLIEALKRSCLAPETLYLKKGARVMCVKNNFEKGYVNGTLGVVVSCGPGVPPVIRTSVSAEHPNGRLITIEPAVWAIDDETRTIAEIEQYPLRLAWAITVHKSQGMSLDAVEVDLSRSFEPGMGYVALSRVRTLDGLRILGMNENAFHVHPEVLEYDGLLRQRSKIAERGVESMNAEDLIQRQKEFLARVASLHSMQRAKPSKQKKKKGKPAVIMYD